MRRRRYIGLTGIAATAGCLRLQNQQTDGDGSGTELSQGSGADREVSGTWPQYGYDTANSGTATDESGPTEEITKQWHITDNQTHALGSSPAVVDGIVYIVTNSESDDGDNAIWALDATSGETRWQQPLGVWKHSPVIADGQLFCGTTSGEVVALDADTGAYNWEVSIDGRVDSQNHLTATNEIVFVTDEDGRFYQLSTDDGSELGRIDLQERCFSGPAVADGRAFVATFGPTDPDDYPEETAPWLFSGGDPESEPLNSLVEMDGSGTVHMISSQDGDVQWSVDLPHFVTATPTVVDETVYVGCWDGYLYALDAADGSRVWRYELGSPISGGASVADGTVYVGGWDATLHAVNTDGTREWILPSDYDDTRIISKPAIADGVVYTNETRSIIVADTDGQQLGAFQGDLRWFDASSPAVADGALFVCGLADTRTVDGEEANVGGMFKLV